MKNNQLVLLDMVSGFLLLPLSILFRVLRKLFSKAIHIQYEGILIIKFLGAGNFIAIQNKITGKNIDLVTAKSNEYVLKNFRFGRETFFIDESSFFNLFLSASACCFKIFFKNYHQVINLESESSFAKFLTSLTSAKILSGVSSSNKSYIDFWLYDRYLVNPQMLNKIGLISQLDRFHPVTNIYMKSAILEHCRQFDKSTFLHNIKTVTISPSCSNTDNMRRLSNKDWNIALSLLSKACGIEKIVAVFPNSMDSQFQSFVEMQSIYPILDVRVTSYKEFIDHIESADLLVTIDSQALHLRQQFNKASIVFFGPTSPFGVNLTIATYPVTKALVCSPCTHKYLRLPCENLGPCMNFDSNFLDVLLEINQ
jgi:ADP-heptose:LPS heptosyltransferase